MSSSPNRKITLVVACAFLVVVSSWVLVSKVVSQENAMVLRNANDSLVPFVELATESGGTDGRGFRKAQKSHAKMIQQYVAYMKMRDVSFLLRLSSFSRNNNVLTQWEEIAAKLNNNIDASSEDEARKNIKEAAALLAKFFSKSDVFTKTKGVTSELKPEVMSKEIQQIVRDAFKEAHIKAKEYANAVESFVSISKALDLSEEACMSNRIAATYLNLARFGYQNFLKKEVLEEFRTDISRSIYYNRFLQQIPEVQVDKDNVDSVFQKLQIHTSSELRRLDWLQAIMDMDMQKAQTLMQRTLIIALKKDFPDLHF
jgi:hypothetical protein